MVQEVMRDDSAYLVTNHLDNQSPLWAAPIGQDGIAVIVHPDNAISSLTSAQLRDIYQGWTSNWSDLGGRRATSSSSAAKRVPARAAEFESLVMGSRRTTSNRADRARRAPRWCRASPASRTASATSRMSYRQRHGARPDRSTTPRPRWKTSTPIFTRCARFSTSPGSTNPAPATALKRTSAPSLAGCKAPKVRPSIARGYAPLLGAQ